MINKLVSIKNVLKLRKDDGTFNYLDSISIIKSLGVKYLNRVAFDGETFPLKSKHFLAQKFYQIQELDSIHTLKHVTFLTMEEILEELYIAKINQDIGFGIFASVKIPGNTCIGEYTGFLKNTKTDMPANADYIMKYGKTLLHAPICIDAYKAGNHTRFINHSYWPNVNVFTLMIKGEWKNLFITCDDIKPGQQLFINYGFNYWYMRNIKPLPLPEFDPFVL
ncbi:MAG: SET domain-containing protein-lysine N-methyltransferase [Candidatus Margulisbacteria bacterium]|nr:SET domain-containing protein-lysine N-methyltransferase [Candidatus Margulisiibacteriota bacterium]